MTFVSQKRPYSQNPLHDAVEIVGDVVLHGVSSGWSGPWEHVEAIKQIVKSYGVYYADDMRGDWRGPSR